MKFATYTLITTYVMAALGVLALWLIDTTGPPFIIVTSAFILLSLIYNVKKMRLMAGRVWNMLAVAMFLFFIVDYLTISTSLITSATRLATALLILKLFDLKRNRDYLIVFSLICFQLLAAAASTVSPIFVLALTLFIMCGIWAMIIFSIKVDFYAANNKLEIPSNIFSVGFFLSIIAVSAGSLIITFMLFFIIPRMGAGFLQQRTLNTMKVTGFSDSVVLGSMGEIKKDPTVLMRVEPLSPVKSPLYIRGAVLDHYDGVSWTETVKQRTLMRSASGVFQLRGGKAGTIGQKILLEPLDTEVLFGVSHLTAIEGGFRNLWVDPAGTVRLPAPLFSRVEYRAWSSPAPMMQGPGKMPDAYTETDFLDETPEGGRIRELARRLSEGKTSDIDKAAAIEEYLRNNSTYSLDPAREPDRAPLDDFLFYSREGFCEHFATSMAVLLRASGVPSRIVTGFLSAEWNSPGGYYVVRGQDSHSWVEAYVDGAGWKIFDPTPPPPVDSVYRPSAVSEYADLLRWRWNRYIVHFTSDDQSKAASGAGAGVSGYLAKLKKSFGAKGRTNGASGLILPVLLLCLLAVVIWAARKSVFKGGKTKTPGYYTEMLSIVEKMGLKKMPHETPLEFAQRTLNPRVHEITVAYQAEKYGNAVLSEAERYRIREALEGLKRNDA